MIERRHRLHVLKLLCFFQVALLPIARRPFAIAFSKGILKYVGSFPLEAMDVGEDVGLHD